MKVAAIQLISSNNVVDNLTKVKDLIENAKNAGAKFIALPENFAFMGEHETDKLQIAENYANGYIQNFIKDLAVKNNLFILAGTIPIKSDDANKIYARSILFGPNDIINYYDKMHLFDVEAKVGEHYCESNTIKPGIRIVNEKIADFNLGFSVCYDLRFPELYRQLIAKNVNLIAVPSAFTKTTGIVHWEVLLRARAIENLSYVIAPNQVDQFLVKGQNSFGHSMIISPWGEILAQLPKGEGFIIAELDIDKLNTIRTRFGALKAMRL